MPKYSNIAKEGGQRTTWGQSSPLGNLIGVTMSSEALGAYNRQFSASFAKTGLVGLQTKAKKGTNTVILMKKASKEAKVIVQNNVPRI